MFLAEETPRFWHALFENLHICKAGSGGKSRSLFLLEAYLNEIRHSRGVTFVQPIKPQYGGPPCLSGVGIPMDLVPTGSLNSNFLNPISDDEVLLYETS